MQLPHLREGDTPGEQWESKGSWATGGITVFPPLPCNGYQPSCHRCLHLSVGHGRGLIGHTWVAAWEWWVRALEGGQGSVYGALVRVMTETRQMHRRQDVGHLNLLGLWPFSYGDVHLACSLDLVPEPSPKGSCGQCMRPWRINMLRTPEFLAQSNGMQMLTVQQKYRPQIVPTLRYLWSEDSRATETAPTKVCKPIHLIQQ